MDYIITYQEYTRLLEEGKISKDSEVPKGYEIILLEGNRVTSSSMLAVLTHKWSTDGAMPLNGEYNLVPEIEEKVSYPCYLERINSVGYSGMVVLFVGSREGTLVRLPTGPNAEDNLKLGRTSACWISADSVGDWKPVEQVFQDK